MSGKIRLVLITGLSGSGKSSVAKCFEDLGYYCIDNLPLPLLREFLSRPLELGEGHEKISVVTDVRAAGFAAEFPRLVAEMDRRHLSVTLLFLEASEDALVRRFSETRRPHPLAGDRPLLDGIRQERELLAEVRGVADLVLDTSDWSIHEVRNQVFREFAGESSDPSLTGPVVSLVSFGFKHGIPPGTDLLFDVRFMSNPHFVPELQDLTGLDAAVRQFLDKLDDYHELLQKVEELLLFLLPRFSRENRSYVSVAVGCTGGRHRSVAVAEELANRLQNAQWSVRVIHRDIAR
ncbi:MAG: RNase adapter RapZ [Thermoanaerobaculia bacterium]